MALRQMQMQALAKLIEDAETTVELYWDTENGQRLSRALEAVRNAFDGQDPDQFDPVGGGRARVIIEAQCSTCGPLEAPQNGPRIIRIAMEHSCSSGHVVVLNGTVDIEDLSNELML